MTAYVGFVMILSFFVDILLLCGTDRILGGCLPMKSAIPGASLGGAYAGICLLEASQIFAGMWVRVLILFLTAWAAYGLNLRRMALFVLLMLSLGGITSGFLTVETGEILICAGCIVILLITAKRARAELIPMELSYKGHTMRIMALQDTGNGLQDPISGESVIVVSPQIAYEFTGLTKQQLSRPTQILQLLPGSRLIPYRTVGTDNGFLLAVRFPEVKVRGKKGSALVAFAPAGFQINGSFQALTGRLN